MISDDWFSPSLVDLVSYGQVKVLVCLVNPLIAAGYNYLERKLLSKIGLSLSH